MFSLHIPVWHFVGVFFYVSAQPFYVFLHFVVLGCVSSVLATRFAGKNISKMT